jgi:predicted phage terminase large subunit-like protein
MIDAARVSQALRRQDLASFVRFAYPIVHAGSELNWNWHLDAICHQLELVARGECKRLIIEVQPRSLKSFIASVAFPAWLLGRNPAHRLITASYSQALANQHCDECRVLMRDLRYLALFAGTRIGDKDSESEFRTTRRGGRIATSTGATLTGRGGNTIILDDVQKPDEAMSVRGRENVINWFRNTLYSRLDNKIDGAIIVVMQRLHMEDLAGHLRAQGGWNILSLPAIATVEESISLTHGRVHRRRRDNLLHPQREPQAILDDIKREIGSYNFSAQYQQEPVPEHGSIIKWDWFRWFDEVPPGSGHTIVQSWDVGMKPEDTNDYSVCTTWAVVRRDYYLLSLFRARLGFPDLVRKVVEHARHHRAEVLLIEDKASGTPLIQQLQAIRTVGVPYPIAIVPKLDKVTRAHGESLAIEAGQVYLKTGAPWLAELRSEIAQFPNGRHDDQVDSVTQFLTWQRERAIRSLGTMRIR